MNEREIKGLAIVGGVTLLGIAILNQVYQAGVSAGLAASGNPAARIDHGFFPFPPFALLVIGGLVFLAWRRRGMHGGPGRGPGGGRPPRIFEEWHRQAHEGSAADSTPAGSTEPQRPVETSMV